MVVQQVDHMISVCVCVCARVYMCGEREVYTEGEGGMREEEGKEEEGYREWLRATTSVRDFFFSSKRLSRERWRLFLFWYGGSGGGEALSADIWDEETTGSRTRRSL